MDDLIGPYVQIVLGVIEGQGFGFLKNPVYVTGSLNSHTLESDSIGACASPFFGTNLIWQADKKGLRLMRTGNIPMKVECFTINQQNRKERIGYLLLSLRSIQIAATGKSTNLHQCWYKLMGTHNEAKSSHPELLLSFHVEDDTQKNEPDDKSPENITKIVPPTSSVHSGQRHPNLVPRLCSEEGLIQIGPEDECSDTFSLSILIGTANNLEMLLPNNKKEVNNYSFWYSIFGHSIQTKPFHRNLHQPCALNEKIVLRLRSSLKVLKIYFTEVSLMTLKLLCGTEEIGYANMELKGLVPTENLTEFFARYAVNSIVTQNARCFLLTKTGKTPCDEQGRKPVINMEIKLKYLPAPKFSFRVNDAESKMNLERTSSNQITARSTSDMLNDMEAVHDDEIPLRSTSLTGLEPKAVTSCYQEPTPRVCTEAGDYKVNLMSDLFKQISPHVKTQASASTGNITDRQQKNVFQIKSTGQIPHQVSPMPESTVDAYHRYSLNVSLISVSFSQNLNRHVVFRFHHPKAEVIYSSHPEIMVNNINEMILLNNVKCLVNFVSTPEEIGRLLLAWPPKISLCENCSDGPVILGELALDTSLLFQNEAECSYVGYLCDKSDVELAQMKISMVMEDCGLKVKCDKENKNSDQVLGPPILDERIAYKLIEELEDWKEKQQIMFKSELSRKEEQRLQLLSNEWNSRRADLEAKLSKGVEKCRILALNLERATDEQKIKTAKCLDAETKFKRLKEDIEHSFGVKSHDMKDLTRKLDQEYNSKIQIIKTENAELIEKVSALERENALLKDTVKTHEMELSDLRKSTLTTEQTASLLQELKSLEEKLEASMKSKAFFKEEWGKTVREIHRMKAEHQKQLQNQIRLNKEELSNLKIKNLLNDEDFELKSDRNALSKIRSELNCLKNFNEGTKSKFADSDEYNYTSRPDLLDMNQEEKTAMLIEERDALLRTGSYSEQDPIIIKLNQELQNVLGGYHLI